ncbi:MAG: hypothetical protein F4126_10440, partial [Acidimicrobiaceae bacterium]|nr:hypothetical protein [Acidimicrobiaceae bacterium]
MTNNRRRPKWLLIVSLLAVFAVVAAACADDADDAPPPATTAAPEAAPETDDETPAVPAAEAPRTQGPGGEEAVASSEVTLSGDEIAEVQGGGYTAALLWHTAG